MHHFLLIIFLFLFPHVDIRAFFFSGHIVKMPIEFLHIQGGDKLGLQLFICKIIQ